MIVYWLPRSGGLDVFMATDEGVWLFRSANFYYGLGQRDFEKTYTESHPGVITSWVGTAGMLAVFPEYRGQGQGYFMDYLSYHAFLTDQGVEVLDVLVASRRMMVLLLTLVLGGCFFISLKLFGTGYTSLGFLLIAFDPLFLATSRTFHLDAPMAAFTLLSLLALLLFNKDENHPPLLLLISGAAAGLAVLAKITAVVYCAAAVGLLVLHPLLRRPAERFRPWREAGRSILLVAAWGGAALLALVAFWPVMWVEPAETLTALAAYALGTDAGTVDFAPVFVPPRGLFFYNPLRSSWMNYPASFMWRTTPTVLIGLVLAGAAAFLKPGQWKERPFRISLLGLLLFVGAYTLIMGAAAKQSQKYYVPAILVMNLIAGFGLAALPYLLTQARLGAGRALRRASLAIICGLVILQLALVLPTHPYYFTYYNPLLGGAAQAQATIFIGTGEGLNLAGDYLNSKPDPQDIKVLAWYGTGCLSLFFDGEVEIIDLDNNWSDREQTALREADYLVTYANQWFRGHPEELLAALEDIPPEHTVRLHGITYARIYDTSDLPESLFGE